MVIGNKLNSLMKVTLVNARGILDELVDCQPLE